MTDSVTRYVVTYVDKSGMRTLAESCQGRYTYATPAEAEAVLQALVKDNSPRVLEQLYGHPSRGVLEVRPVECWPRHFDPKGVWFD